MSKARDDIRRFSLDEINAMRARGEALATPPGAPELEIDEAFWEAAEVVASRPTRKASVHLRVDPDTLSFFRAGGRGHLTRMANVLKAYAEASAKRQRG